MPGRGCGRHKFGSSKAKVPPSREETISKAMSYVLRHGAEKEKLKLDEGGYINCMALLEWHRLKSLKVSFPELQHIVATNPKQRFAMIPDPSTSSPPTQSSPSKAWLIRATQGHSLAIASSALLTPLLPTGEQCPKLAVHGTLAHSWKKILESGAVKTMGRQHIHFAMDVPSSKNKLVSKMKGGEAATFDLDDTQDRREDAEGEVQGGEKVISGMRNGADVLVWVHVKKSAEEGGIKWWKSENGVVLTEGDEKGEVPLKWVDRVERRETREVIWKPSGEEERDQLRPSEGADAIGERIGEMSLHG